MKTVFIFIEIVQVQSYFLILVFDYTKVFPLISLILYRIGKVKHVSVIVIEYFRIRD